MLKFFFEISSVIISFVLIFSIAIRLPKEIIGLFNSKTKRVFSQKSINNRILFSIIYLFFVLIFLDIGK